MCSTTFRIAERGCRMLVCAVADETVWLTVKQAAAVAQCGMKTIYREVRAGRLRAARIGARRDLRIHRDWVNEWLVNASTPVAVVPMRMVTR
jgi:excisionase family DNA binding protein